MTDPRRVPPSERPAKGGQQGELLAGGTERLVLAGAGDAGSGRREEVAPMEGGAHGPEARTGVVDGADLHTIRGGTGTGAGGAGIGGNGGGEEAVVGADEVAGGGGVAGDGGADGDGQAVAPHAGIDDGEHDRRSGEEGEGGLEQPRALVDCVGRDLVGEIDEGGARRARTEDGLHLAHVGVARPEVSEQEDGQGGGHPMRHSCTLRKRSAGQKSTPIGGDSTVAARR